MNQDQATAQLRRAAELIDLNRPEQALEVLGALLTTAPPLAARIYASLHGLASPGAAPPASK